MKLALPLTEKVILYAIQLGAFLLASLSTQAQTSPNSELMTGRVVVWGQNTWGQTDIPPSVALSGVIGVAGGGNHSLALKYDGTVVAWGKNDRGQTDVPSELTDVVKVAAGGHHSLALKRDGTIVAWGYNYHGQCSIPVGLSNVTAIAAGEAHSLALKGDGKVVAWGSDGYLQSTVPSELTGCMTIAAGVYHSAAIMGDRTIVIWGGNQDSTTTVPGNLSNVVSVAAGYSFTVALKQNGTVVGWGYNAQGQTNVPAGLRDVTAVAAGGYHALALLADGTVTAWGWIGGTVPIGLKGVMAISAGSAHSIALVSTSCVPHKATAIAELANGFVIGAAIMDSGCGYVDAPVVRFEGGGGNGAAATALITEGRVTGITITSAGINYTSPPRIVIPLPPTFEPSSTIEVSRVEVVLSVIAGRNYVLESSRNGKLWQNIVPPFRATSDTITNQFDTALSGRSFRVRENPECLPHKAAATAELANGFVVGATVTDSGCGYFDAPLVTFEGGGGNGAAATALITDGRVTGINITSAGIGYVSSPRIVIQLPPPSPAISATVRVIKAKVVQNVFPSRRYVLETSFDARAWNEVALPFTADTESVTNEFDTGFTGRFFRVREVQ